MGSKMVPYLPRLTAPSVFLIAFYPSCESNIHVLFGHECYQWFGQFIGGRLPGYLRPLVTRLDSTRAAARGIRVGWLGQITPWLSVGASWQSKTYGDGFKKYKGLFADQGDFDVPSSYGIGVAVKASDTLDLAADVRRIAYSDVGAVGNSFQRLLAGRALGSSDGPGFGWKDTTSIKIGANYALTPDWQIRAGYGYTTQPIPQSQTFLNILAPATIQHQITAGATWSVSKSVDVSLYGLYGLPTTVKGSGSIPAGFPPAGFGGGEANIRLSEIALGGGVSWRF